MRFIAEQTSKFHPSSSYHTSPASSPLSYYNAHCPKTRIGISADVWIRYHKPHFTESTIYSHQWHVYLVCTLRIIVISDVMLGHWSTKLTPDQVLRMRILFCHDREPIFPLMSCPTNVCGTHAAVTPSRQRFQVPMRSLSLPTLVIIKYLCLCRNISALIPCINHHDVTISHVPKVNIIGPTSRLPAVETRNKSLNYIFQNNTNIVRTTIDLGHLLIDDSRLHT